MISNRNSQYLSAVLHTAAKVEVFDESDGIFGELIDPQTIVQSSSIAANSADNIENDNNLVGDLTNPDSTRNHSPPKILLRSQDYPISASFSNVIQIQFHNNSQRPVRVGWIDHSGQMFSQGTVHPFGTLSRNTRAGHLFVLRACDFHVMEDWVFEDADDEGAVVEKVLGAYRPMRVLPSGKPHCITVSNWEEEGVEIAPHQEELEGNIDISKQEEVEEENSQQPRQEDKEKEEEGRAEQIQPNNKNSQELSFILEFVLIDETKYDAMIVTAASLDHTRTSLVILNTLCQLVNNVLQHPTESKYRKVRLSNARIQRTVGSSWSAMELLRVLGFRRTKEEPQLIADGHDDNTDTKGQSNAASTAAVRDVLLLPTPTQEMLHLFKQALNALSNLKNRRDPKFVAELAPPTPWQSQPFATIASNNNSTGVTNNFNRGGFITDDERWARAERNARRNRAGGGRPPPGSAPSSHGNWGR
mmetsp:Transcript_40043/g.58907  ORF Transcript_40043/g.58907 Transcript_40043/m.58907 type:complete len:474 (-) Transcript_40043:276-1697(-)|eukprot:CAMPEP_0195511042 /NCGR_PEP_ID=MMETSP0794_2-20130614/3500_1 /TAXON_ID=515487 /ORGANISM="Stephanopyxis turris, Strain CCMP 815" /LENGTH=473 /DNA_ID=CAMNT_0040638579 /DNA_START=84 /DNA_END=1505 /DNA_ORIENTATION=+